MSVAEEVDEGGIGEQNLSSFLNSRSKQHIFTMDTQKDQSVLSASNNHKVETETSKIILEPASAPAAIFRSSSLIKDEQTVFLASESSPIKPQQQSSAQQNTNGMLLFSSDFKKQQSQQLQAATSSFTAAITGPIEKLNTFTTTGATYL